MQTQIPKLIDPMSFQHLALTAQFENEQKDAIISILQIMIDTRLATINIECLTTENVKMKTEYYVVWTHAHYVAHNWLIQIANIQVYSQMLK